MKRLLVSSILMVTMVFVSYAQNILVKGTVLDTDSQPVPGAVVMQVGTKNAAIVSIDGDYQISVPSNASLEVSCMGYVSQNVAVSGRASINFILQSDSQLLDDVIVVAFGKQTKESFTGSATVVKSETIAQRQVSSPIAALNGQVAGLQMVEGNGPDSSPSLVIRGFGSINAGNSPLIVLDGLPYNGYWSDINPQDVESISVLKDAASNALYGARGANGVIMITTKSAQRGKASITFDAKVGLNMDGKVYYDYIDDPATYCEAYYSMLYNYYRNARGQKYSVARNSALSSLGGSATSGGLGYLVYNVPSGQALIGEDGKINPNATLGNKVTGVDGNEYLLLPDDWKKEGIRNGLRKEYNININGGNDVFQFIGSLGYLTNEGLTYGSYYERFTARAKADYQAREWLKIGANMTYTKNISDAMQNAFGCSYDMSPIYPLYVRDGNGNILTDAHGKVYDYGDGAYLGITRPIYINDNPLQSDLLDINENDSNAFGLQGYADIKFYKDLTLTINGSVYDTENRWSGAANPYYGYYQNTGGYTTTYHYRTFDINLQQLLQYNHSFGSHNVSVLLGHEYNKNIGTTLGAYKGQIFAYEAITELDGALIKQDIEGSKSEYNTEGYLFRGQYDYMSKYFASASYRRDGSSTFHPDHCWGNFWSVGGAWIVSKEDWFNVPVFNEFKLKASYGKQGNDGIPDYYYTRQYYISTVNSEAATTFKSQGNENISWETNGNFNTGIEFSMFNNRLSGGLDYYYRKTTDMLLWKSVPLGMGYSGYYDNVGDMVNSGVEFSISGDIIRTKKVTWNANFNISHNRNEVTYLPDEKAGKVIDGHAGYLNGDRFIGMGLPIYTWYQKKYAGVNEVGLPLWYYDDANGERQTTTTWDNGDYYLCGDPHPTVYGGFGTSLSAYGFDIAINMLYTVGGTVYDGGYQSLMGVPYTGYTGNNLHKDILNAWSEDNPDSNIPRAQFNDDNINSSSDRWLIDGSALTLKNINLGYTFPSKVTDKMKISSLRFYVSCDNIAYWSKRKGLDPRTSLSGNASATGYSPMRTISGGLTVKF